MTIVDAATFQKVFNEPSLSVEHIEEILDLAIDFINLYSDADLSNMSGVAGSKTVELESKEKAAVFEAAYAIYQGFYVGPTTAVTMGQTVSHVDVKGNPTVLASVKEAARLLAELDVSYG